MKKVLLIAILIFSIMDWGFAQQNYNITISIKDSVTGNYLNSSSIVITETGKVYKTDQNGKAIISTILFPVSFSISNIGYQTQTLKLQKPEKFKEIFLIPVVKTFNTVVIQTPKPHKLIQNIPLYIVDYEIKNDSIYFIGYKNKSKSDAYLMIANLMGDTLLSIKVEGPEKLFKDCFGNIHILCKNQALQVFTKSSGIELLYPTKRDEFEKTFEPITAYSNETFYVKKYSMSEQILNYYSYNVSKKKLEPFVTISNNKNLLMLRDFGRLASASNFSEADARFEKMCFYNPLFAPLFTNRDSIFLFNLCDSVIKIFRNDLQEVSTAAIEPQLYTDFKNQIIIDPVLNNFFAVKIKNGHCSIAQINPYTSEIISQIKIPDLPFVQKISVWKNQIYFLYSDICASGYKKIYVMKI